MSGGGKEKRREGRKRRGEKGRMGIETDPEVKLDMRNNKRERRMTERNIKKEREREKDKNGTGRIER